jgi:hypothetical protein
MAPDLQQAAASYPGDHARLLVRYLLSLTPDEQARARAAMPARAPAPSGATPTGQTPAAPVASHSPAGEERPPSAVSRQGVKAGRKSASRGSRGRGRRVQASWRGPARRARAHERWRQSASVYARAGGFSP